MARRTRTRYRTRVKKVYSRRKGLLSGNMNNIIWGAAGGFVSGMIPQFLGKWTNPVAFGAAGWLLKKPAFLSIAGYEIGKAFSGGSIFKGGSGGFWE
jgi:hypothetical protein